jgi:hypothetical protein
MARFRVLQINSPRYNNGTAEINIHQSKGKTRVRKSEVSHNSFASAVAPRGSVIG